MSAQVALPGGLELIRLEQPSQRLARVVLDRPPANALSHQFMDEMGTVTAWLATTETQLVVLRSDAEMFMAGADLNMVNEGWDDQDATTEKCQHMMNRWERLPMLTLAAIGGHALGAGCELAMSCDFRVMARGRARIGLPESLRGLISAAGGTQRMSRLVGAARALDLCVRGRMITADEAEQYGLVTEAVDAEQLDERIAELCEELLGLPRLTTQAIKRCILEGWDLSLAEGFALERRELAGLRDTHDTREGVQSFIEKRAPNFIGR
jgi:enoyl-CoA hydratase/carnithine racemase